LTGAVVLRPVGPADEAFLSTLYASTRQDELALTGWDDDQKAAFCRQQFSAQSAWYADRYPGASFQVVELGDTPAGRLSVDRREDEIRIIDIALLPQFRGLGVGTALITDLQGEAAATGRPVTISVARSNPALALYRRLGFVPVGGQEVHVLMRWEPPPGRSTAG